MLDSQGKCRSCPDYCLMCSSNETKCEICECGFKLDPRDNKCYMEIYTPTDQDNISQNYRLANTVPINYTITDDGTRGKWTGVKGRIEMKVGDTWGTICSKNANNMTAAIICKSVGLPTENAELVKNYPIGAADNVAIWYDQISCTGTESELKFCLKSRYTAVIGALCDHSMDLGAICK